MSSKPLRFCLKGGCKTKHINASGYCNDHKKERTKGKERPRSETAYMYNNEQWRNYSRRFRLCAQVCTNFNICGGLAECVDHIKPVSQGCDFWDADNHQALCNSCHARKSGKESGFSREFSKKNDE